MVASALQLATRAFVRVLLALASQYSVSLSVNRDSSDVALLSAYRRLLKKAHPDKGGRKEDLLHIDLGACSAGGTLFRRLAPHTGVLIVFLIPV